VFDTDLDRFTSDERIWTYEGANGFAIVTADSDFVHLSRTIGPPPRVIWLENCNYKTAVVEELLRQNAIRIAELEQNDRALLIIGNR